MIEVKKILFIGKFNNVFQDIDFLEKTFNVQICVDNAPMVRGMLKIKNPDLVVLSLIGISADAEKICEELRFNYSQTPVICIAAKEDVDTYKNSIDTSQFTTLISPITNNKFLDTINNILCISNNDSIPCNNRSGKKNILLIDDSNIQLRALNELLKEKYEVSMATSATQALKLISENVPDMIFLDYEMPICDGKKTLEMIREQDESKDVPVVFLTGVSNKKHIDAVLLLKPAGYLLKPAKSKTIYAIIEKILG